MTHKVKNIVKVVLLAITVMDVFMIYAYQKEEAFNHPLHFSVENGNPVITLIKNDEKLRIYQKEDSDYFFLPSYLGENMISYDITKYEVTLDQQVTEGGKIPVELNQAVNLEVRDIQNDNKILYSNVVTFMKSANIYTMYINLNEGDKWSINRAEYKNAKLRIINPNGTVNFYGENQQIKGRGNSTWGTDKHPYTLKLSKDTSLCGMEAGKDWVLLANIYEGTHMANKITLDMASAIGLEYTTQSDWVDLYLNGEYQGNYLLCEKVTIDTNRVDIENLEEKNEKLNDVEQAEHFNFAEKKKGYLLERTPDNITGGYLIEKDYDGYYEDEPCGFCTDSGQPFTMKSPKYASMEEVEYIQGVTQNIENLLSKGDKQVFKYIDVDSFAKRFLIEEIVLNSDSSVTSYYFYKKEDDEKLYAGPVWDYDGVLGNSDSLWNNYTRSILSIVEDRGDVDKHVLSWDADLYHMQEYREYMIKIYQDFYPYLQELLDHGIDEYADKIYDSLQMDKVLWRYGDYGAGHYESYENNVKYMKFFLQERLNFMNERWNLPYEKWIPEIANQLHTVYIYYEGDTMQFQVADGDVIHDEEDLPQYDNEKYSGWRYARDQKFVSEWLPVYEDIILYANPRG